MAMEQLPLLPSRRIWPGSRESGMDRDFVSQSGCVASQLPAFPYPPLQKTQGRGTLCCGGCRQITGKGWATRPFFARAGTTLPTQRFVSLHKPSCARVRGRNRGQTELSPLFTSLRKPFSRPPRSSTPWSPEVFPATQRSGRGRGPRNPPASPDGWPSLPSFPFPFRNCGCPVLAFFARAGTMLPVPCGLSCPAACIALTARITCTLSLVRATGDCRF